MMKAAMPKVAGRADGKRVSRARRRRRCALMRRQIELSNEVAAALTRRAATRSCARSRATSTASVFLRGNVVTLDGDAEAVAAAATVVARARRARSSRATRSPRARSAAVTGALDQHESPARDPRGRRLAPPLDEGRAEDRQPEALRRLDPQQHDHVRHRPGRHRQDVPRRRDGRRRADAGARSTASSSRARRSRPASASASCPAT